jgi:hypothetical protein
MSCCSRFLLGIFPSGRLRGTDDELNAIVSANGVFEVCFHRLYISRMKWKDPSVSLHDDAETALVIAGGYFSDSKRVYLFECNIPKIWSVGWRVWDIQDDKVEWFSHRDVWFNSKWERTERYLLYGIPLSPKVLQSVRVFDDEVELEMFVEPFRIRQHKLKTDDELQ